MDEKYLKKITSRYYREILVIIPIIFALFFIRLYNYLIFYILSDILNIIMFFSIYAIIQYSKKSNNENFFKIMGLASLYIAIIDFLYLLSINGINIISNFDRNLPDKLLLVDGFLFSSGILVASIFYNTKKSQAIFFIPGTALFVFILFLLFYGDLVPAFYIKGEGFTTFKIFAGFFIIALLFPSLIILNKNKSHAGIDLLSLLLLSVFFGIISEFCFIFFGESNSEFNFTGHIFKMIAVFLLFKTVARRDIQMPNEKLTRLSSFQEFNPNPVSEIDMNGNILYLNNVIKTIFPELESKGLDHLWFGGMDNIISFSFVERINSVYRREIKINDSYYEQNIVYLDYGRIRIYGTDISERKLFEIALQKSEERFRMILDRSPISIANQDSDFRYTWVYNPLPGYSQDDIIGKSDRDIFSGVTSTMLSEIKKRVYENKSGDRQIVRINHDNDIYYYDMVMEPLLDESGLCKGVTTIIINISDYKKMEESYMLSKFCIDKAADGFIWISPESRIVYANDKACKMYEYSLEDMIKLTVQDIVPGMSKERWQSQWESIKTYGSYMLETEHTSKNGNNIPVEVTVNYIKFNDREFNCSIVRDITERKKIEEVLKKSHNEMEVLVAKRTEELANLNLKLKDKIQEIQSVSNQLIRKSEILEITNKLLQLIQNSNSRKEYADNIMNILEGIKKSDFTGIRIVDGDMMPFISMNGKAALYFENSICVPNTIDGCICSMVAGKGSFEGYNSETTGEGLFLTNGISEFISTLPTERKNALTGKCFNGNFQSLLVVPVKYGENHLGMIIFLDEKPNSMSQDFVQLVISVAPLVGEGFHKFSMSEKIDETRKELDLSRRLSDIGTLAATIAHELRNPLAAIRMATYNIKQKAKNPGIEKHVQNIDKKVTESDKIISNLLFYTRINSADYQKINIYDLIDETVDDINCGISGKNIRLVKKYKILKNTTLHADPILIRELLENLLNNSFDAVLDVDGVIEIGANLGNGNSFEIFIKDNGCGVDHEDLGRIFDPFYSTKSKGIGLGLSVCRQIVSLHHGEIKFESEKNNGTVVTITLTSGE